MLSLKFFIIFLAIYLTIGLFIGYLLMDLFHSFESGIFDDEDFPIKDDPLFISTAGKICYDDKFQRKALRLFVLGWPYIWIESGFLSLPYTIASYLFLKRRSKYK